MIVVQPYDGSLRIVIASADMAFSVRASVAADAVERAEEDCGEGAECDRPFFVGGDAAGEVPCLRLAMLKAFDAQTMQLGCLSQ